MEGVYGDATPFSESSVNIAEKLCERLAKSGFERQGWEEMYSGFTGEPLEAKVFIGPTYYQRLKHMVKDKIHSRAQGHVTTLMRQPLEGRSRDGGLRFGEIKVQVSVVSKILLVYDIVGNISKLRENPVKSLILSYSRNTVMVLVNH
jgi:DNA-directed RNA polymerase beta subunit